MKIRKKKFTKVTKGAFPSLIILAALILSLYLSPHDLRAQSGASLYLGPASGTFTVGSTFNVSLYLNTGGQFVNALETYLTFPPDKLQIVSPTAGKSFIQVWTNQPTYSNKNGTLTFQGGVHNPGINTEAGVVSTVTFRVKDTGTATIKILDTSRVFLADGKGTDVLREASGALFHFTLPPPAGPVVVSRTNPDQEKWTATKIAVFRWEALPDIQGFSYVLDSSPVNEPDNISEGVRTSAAYENLADGIYYFHVKSLRESVWGGVTHYQAKIDNTPPASFAVAISPSDYTSNRRPVISFATTDVTSGIDHYELKIIPLDPYPESRRDKPSRMASAASGDTPFFIEIHSPYTERLDIGRYDVIVRAYDAAGNYYQAQKKLTVANPFFEIVRGRGIRLWGEFVIGWPYVGGLSLILFLFLAFFARTVWEWHREIETQLRHGALKHPNIAHKFEGLLEKIKEKQKDYRGGKNLILWGIVITAGLIIVAAAPAYGQGAGAENVTVEPPVVTLFPEAISNDEILYIGGRSGAPSSEIIVNLQRVDTGSTLSQTVTTDKTGAWFYSFPQFLNSGHYRVWTQLKVGDTMSLPSPQFNLSVAPTAVQIGSYRFSYQGLYLFLFLISLAGGAALLIFIIYHSYHFRTKRGKLLQEIKDAEESIRRGFAVLRRDIEAELVLVRKTKMKRELAVEEKLREEKLLKDLEWASGYIGKEVWEIEEAEKEL